MIILYFENQINKLFEKKVDLEIKYNKKIKNQNEKEKFINDSCLNKDDTYNSFSPYNVKNNKESYIFDLKNEIKLLISEKEKIKEEIALNDSEISNLKYLLKEAIKREKYFCTYGSLISNRNKFEHKVLDILELERKRIARELHDSTVQNLTSMVHKAEFCSKLIDLDHVRCKLELQMMSKTIKSEIEDMREVIYNLRPMSFDDIGLDATLEKEIERLKRKTDIKIEYECNNYYNIDNSVAALTILRLVQEACNNAIKYSEASLINIEINFYENEVSIFIIDNGKGFDTNSIQVTRKSDLTGFGISMMRERVDLLFGTIDVNSEINIGTKVSITIPINEEIINEYKDNDNR